MTADFQSAELRYRQWLEKLRGTDPRLHAELSARLQQRLAAPTSMKSTVSGVTLETAASASSLPSVTYETIVREGRPALMIQKGAITFTGQVPDTAAQVVIDRLKSARSQVEPLIPLVGRIDIANYPGSIPYAGTGWLVGSNLVVTNRHVAELISRSNDGQFVFRPGRFGEPLEVSLDYLHENDNPASDSVKVVRILWIEPDPRKADIAFLEVAGRTASKGPQYFTLAEDDIAENSDVAVIGYPARAPAHIIPDQRWMEEIYGGTYDVKRIAPGLAGARNRGWATHDCTTLGGNSGSVVVDTKTGHAVALHFAGLYLVENYAVPASTIRQYLSDRPWESAPQIRPDRPSGGGAPDEPSTVVMNSSPITSTGPQTTTTASFTIPVTVTVTVGVPQLVSSMPKNDPASSSNDPRDVEQAARRFMAENRISGVYSVWAGLRIEEGRLSRLPCLVVSADPGKLDSIKQSVPASFKDLPVDVWPASIEERLGLVQTEAAASISYNDEDRTGPEFSFDWVEDEMTARFHVGPERGWVELKRFLAGSATARKQVSSMYQFHASHIADAIEGQLDQGASLQLVVANQTHDPDDNRIRPGDFDRSERFEKWERNYGERKFKRVYVPLGASGLVANSYHIKVTVQGNNRIWLSSGNWTRSSQPLIPDADLNDPRKTGAAGNREWHVVLHNKTLAERFASHIKADYERSLELGGTPESIEERTLVDVPRTLLEAVELEAAPSQVFEPLEISRRLRVKPLLTPDKKGAIYTEAVLELIRSARQQLLFQNQYIKMSGAGSGFLKKLVEALAERAQRIRDFRIILRSGDEEMRFNLTQLQRLGVDVNNQVRILANTHTKGIVVDGKRVLLGSHNWSSSGVTLNRDASLIVDDAEVAKYFHDVFEVDWTRARPPTFEPATFERAQLAAGPEAPAGFERITLAEYLEQ